MMMVLIQAVTAYHMNDSNYNLYTIFSNGGELQNTSTTNITFSIGQNLIGNSSTLTQHAYIGIWYTWNTTNVTSMISNMSVIVIHPNITESELVRILYNISWEIYDEIGGTNSTVYLVFSDGTQHKLFHNISVENSLWSLRDTQQGYYRINVSVEDVTTSASDLSDEFYIKEDTQTMEITIAIFLIGITLVLFYFAVNSKSRAFQISFGLLGFFFIVASLWFGARLSDVFLGNAGITSNLYSLYTGAMYIYVFLITIVVILLMFGLFKFLFSLRKRREEREEREEQEWLTFK